jgi:hypothetical protein
MLRTYAIWERRRSILIVLICNFLVRLHKLCSLEQDSLTKHQQFTCIPALVVTQLHLAALRCNYALRFLPD